MPSEEFLVYKRECTREKVPEQLTEALKDHGPHVLMQLIYSSVTLDIVWRDLISSAFCYAFPTAGNGHTASL